MVSTSYPCQAPEAAAIRSRNKLKPVNSVRLIVTAGSAAAMLGLASVAFAAETDVQKLHAAAPANAKVLAAQILSRWAPVAQAAGLNMSVWQEQFTTQLSLMSLNSLSGLDRAEVKSDIDAKANYAVFADAFRAALMVRHMESNKGNAKLGSPTTDQVFIPIVPCRVVDTRNVGGQIVAGFTRNYDFYASTAGFDFSTQGGAAGAASTACPGTVNPNGGAPSAAMMTVTVVSPSDAGNWVIWGGANPVPTASALNWTGPGQILANTTVAPGGGRAGSGPGGAILDFAVKYNGPTGNAHFIADVVGYFVENEATPLDCVTLTAAGTGTGTPGQFFQISAPVCATGYTKTAQGCTVDSGANVPLLEVSLFFSNCIWFNAPATGVDRTLYHSESRCCRVPGR